MPGGYPVNNHHLGRPCDRKLTSSSPIAHGRVLGSPKLIQPKIGTETRRPLFPSWRYSHFELAMLSLSLGGSGSCDMVKTYFFMAGVQERLMLNMKFQADSESLVRFENHSATAI